MSPDALNNFLSLFLGFAVAGALVSGYQAALRHPASFGLLNQPRRLRALGAVPFLVFAAPFLIMRNTLRAREAHARRTEFVMMATILAGIWSLMSGTAVLTALRVTGVLA